MCVCVCGGGGSCFVLVGNLSCTPYAVSCGEFLFHAPCYFYLGSSSYLMLFYVGSFSHAFDAIFHVGSFFYTPHALLCEEFLSCF